DGRRARTRAQEPRLGEGRDDALGPEVPSRAGTGSRACRPPYRAREVQAMNRHTDAGDASVTLLCATFKLSRAAYYAEAGRQRSEPTDPEDGKLIALPKRPRHTSAEVVLARVREV